MKHWLKILLFVFLPFLVNAQKKNIDSLRNHLLTARDDTAKISPLLDLGQQFWTIKPDTSLILFRQALLLSRQNKLIRYEAKSLGYLGVGLALNPKKNDSVMLCIQQAFTLARQNKLLEEEVGCFTALSQVYVYIWQKPDSGILLAHQGMALADKYKLVSPKIGLMWGLINGYRKLQKFDSALQVCLDGVSLSKQNKSFDSEKQFSNFVKYIISLAPPDTARLLTEKAIAWASLEHEKKYEASFRNGLGLSYKNDGNYPEALKAYITVLEMYKNLDDKRGEVEVLGNIGEIYREQSEHRQAVIFFLRLMEIQKGLRDSMIMYTYEKIGYNYAKLKMHDSAIYFAKKSYQEAARVSAGDVPGGVLNDLGELYFELGEDSIAMNYFQESLSEYPTSLISLPAFADWINLCEIYTGIAKLYKKKNQIDSSFHYASMALPIAQKYHNLNYIIDASSIISDYYKGRHKIDSAFVYMQIANDVKDSLFSQEKIKEIQKIGFNEVLRQQQVQEAETKYRNKIRSYILIASLAIVLLIAGILYRNNRHKQKSNILLQHQKEKVETTLSELKTTQSQLIQSEKMASLGELTAGIAHEIQNPLNFVNNFSEVNRELIEELKGEKSKVKSERDEEFESQLLNDIEQNLEKINHHGKRADAIVKGMLQHSRTGSGQKEPTDINALADEYLRLAYHGLRAKDKSINATIQTDFDKSIGKINIIPQDMGRVLVNLINNAFYAVTEKRKQYQNGYEPTITVTTKKENGRVEIKVKDNGNGIPQKVFDKIFQPFFTTKPPGQGTGLGLSLAYDIVKAHGGELKVETKEGEGSVFSIQLSGQ